MFKVPRFFQIPEKFIRKYMLSILISWGFFSSVFIISSPHLLRSKVKEDIFGSIIGIVLGLIFMMIPYDFEKDTSSSIVFDNKGYPKVRSLFNRPSWVGGSILFILSLSYLTRLIVLLLIS